MPERRNPIGLARIRAASRLDRELQLGGGMWKRMGLLSLIVPGAVLTLTCAAFGLRLLEEVVSEVSDTSGSELPRAPMKTVLIRVQNRDLGEIERLLRLLQSEKGEIAVNARERLVRITDYPSVTAHLQRIVHEVDEPTAPDQHLRWFLVRWASTVDIAQVLNRLVDQPGPGIALSKIVPDSKVLPERRVGLLIVVGNPTGHQRVSELLNGPDPTGKEWR